MGPHPRSRRLVWVWWIASVGFSTVIVPSGKGADPAWAAPLREKLTVLVEPLVAAQYSPSVIVGVLREGQTAHFSYGHLSASDPRPPAGDTLFEIGSISKVFTAILLADMAERGEVALDDPIERYLPPGVAAPLRAGEPMRLVHLATHTSGLPRLPNNLGATDTINPYAQYTPDKLYEYLNQRSKSKRGATKRTPEPRHSYSNLGVGLLGHLLELRAGKDYATLLRERVAAPLGLGDTVIVPSEDQQQRVAPGHDAEGNAVPAWQLAVLVGAGGIRSTVEDLLQFAAANLAAAEEPVAADRSEEDSAVEAARLSRALCVAQAPRLKISEDVESGLAWIVERGEIWWHNGGTGGYRSYLLIDRPRRIVVVILTNGTPEGESPLFDQMARRVYSAVRGESVEPLPLRQAIELPAETLADYVGRYELAPRAVLEVTQEGGRLFAQLTGQGRYRLYAEAGDVFFYRVTDAQVTFERDDAGQVVRLILHQNGQDLPAKKLAAREASAAPR